MYWMHKRQITIVILFLALISKDNIVFAQGNSDTASFNEAYRQYNELSSQGEFRESLPYARQALTYGRRINEGVNQTTAALSHNYALNLYRVAQYDEAIDEFETTINEYREVYGEESEALASALFDAGVTYAATRFRPREARRNIRDSVSIISDLYGERSITFGDMSMRAGIVLLDEAGLVDDADSYLENSLEIYEQEYGNTNINTALANFYLGKLNFIERRRTQAAEYLTKAVEGLRGDEEGRNRQLLLTARGFLVQIYEARGDSELATEQLLLISQAVPPSGEADAVPIYTEPPEYPARAARRGIQGWVQVAFTLDELGYPRNPTVVDAEPYDIFDDASLRVITKFRFAPFIEDGEPVAKDNVQYVFRFVLND